MKNKAKRIVSALCALAMFAAMVPAAAFAEGSTTDTTTNAVVSYSNGPAAQSAHDIETINVGQSLTLNGYDDFMSYSHNWRVIGSAAEIVSQDGNSVTIEGVSEGKAILVHSYMWGIFYCVDRIVVKVGSSEPVEPESEEICFYIALPENENMNFNSGDYRFLLHGGEASELASHDMFGEDGAYINLYDEDAIKAYVKTWPAGASIDYSTDYTSPPLGSNSSITIEDDGTVSSFSFNIDGKIIPRTMVMPSAGQNSAMR